MKAPKRRGKTGEMKFILPAAISAAIFSIAYAVVICGISTCVSVLRGEQADIGFISFILKWGLLMFFVVTFWVSYLTFREESSK